MRKILAAILLLLPMCCIHPLPVEASTLEYVEIARSVEQKYDLPRGLLETVCYIESNWKNVHGAHGEIGVCQIKPSTARMTCPECAEKQEYLLWGSVSDRVLDVQDVLNIVGLYNGPLDGIFGPKTDKAVREYQTRNGLKVDGIVGPRTWYAMFGTSHPYKSLIAQLKDPLQNIEIAGMHLRWLADTMDTTDPDILAAAYNGGHGHPVVLYMLRVKNRMPVEEKVDYFAVEDFYYDNWLRL